MKYISLISLFFFAGTVFCQRNIDFTTRVLEPKARDTFVSPGQYYGKYSIINLGPDTVRYNDGYTLMIVFGNVIFPPVYGNFGRAVPPGDSVIVKSSLPTRFDATNYRTEICSEIYKIFWVNKKDSIVAESFEKRKNNRTCIPMVHISYLNTAKIPTDKMLYPNPTKDNLYGKMIQPGYSITIYNSQGKRVHSATMHNQELSLQKLPAGGYWVQIVSPAGEKYTEWIWKE